MTGPAEDAPGGVRTSWVVSMAVALALVGFVAAIQWNGSFERQAYTTSAQQVLAAQVISYQNEQEMLLNQLEATQAQIQSFQEQSSGSATAQAAVNAGLEEARAAAGLTALTGPGVIIEIADSQRQVPEGDSAVNYLVLADDLRDIVAALWHAGAEGVAINGERLVATSSIYGVGSSVLVNTAFLSPPFRIEAVGPAGLDARYAADPAFIGRVGQRIEVYGLEYAAQASDEVALPAYIGSTTLRWAVPSNPLP
jgi:uncharacterized protein YlxW (UPF0749 family)